MISKNIEQNNNGLVPAKIASLRNHYRDRKESTLIDAAAAAVSLNTVFYADEINYDAITPQMEEAFHLAFPSDTLVERLSTLNVNNDAQLAGFMSNWRGKYFEVLVRDELNSGGHVGDLVLADGQTATLAPDLSQPGWDLQIISENNLPVTEFQLKATESISYIKDALERYPDVHIVATDEVAESLVNEAIISSGIDNAEMIDELESPLDAVLDSPLQDAIEAFGAGLPVLLIAGTEGTMWLIKRRTFADAISRSTQRAIRTGTAMTAGLLVAAMGAGALSLPTAVVTRLAFARHAMYSRLGKQVEEDTERVRMLRRATLSK